MSPAPISCRIRVDETPGTSGASRTSAPSRANVCRSPLRWCPKWNPAPGCDELRSRARARTTRRTPPATAAATSGVNSTTSVSSIPSSASSSSRRSSVESSSTPYPSTSRGCGSKVTTVGHEPGSDDLLDQRAMAEVDAVEDADRRRPRPALELGRVAGDVHRPSCRDRRQHGIQPSPPRARAPGRGARTAPARAPPPAAGRAPRTPGAAAPGRPPRPGTARPRSAGASCSGRRAPSRSTGRRCRSRRGARAGRGRPYT